MGWAIKVLLNIYHGIDSEYGSQSDFWKLEVLVALHNGNRFDFPILLRSMKEQGLLEQFLECRPMLLDSLEVITGEKKARGSNLKECKGNMTPFSTNENALCD